MAPRFFQPFGVLVNGETLLSRPIIEVDQHHVVAVHAAGEVSSEEIVSFENEIWARPPLLLHAHAESYSAPSQSFRKASFADWISDLLSWRNSGERVDVSFLNTVRRLKESGTGFVVFHVNPESMDDVLQVFTGEGAYLLWEFLGLDESSVDKFLEEWFLKIPQPVGVSLHSPYSVSLELAKRVSLEASNRDILLSVHLGEHDEERMFVQSLEGPLAHLIHSKGYALSNRTWASSVDWLMEILPERPGPVWAVHGADLTVSELQVLERKGVRLVWCPGTHRYFQRSRPRFFDSGMLPPCLGCDSMASNLHLDPLYELRMAYEILPEYTPQQWWNSLTTQAESWMEEANIIEKRSANGLVGKVADFLRLPKDIGSTAYDICTALATESHWRAISRPDFLKEEIS